ncbi:hypothetical protein [Terriglobus sp. TAA 43]|uniref:hypothetical protein n=1 Tax=Terriglobus sp. TAA 43 TaxID=278961 RepID=UPI0012EE32C4|nr:hypothetical protein [Terriglobus sp. TAA 43]
MLDFLNGPDAFTGYHPPKNNLELLQELIGGGQVKPGNTGRDSLRVAVDEWIATGRDANGVEDPHSRTWSTRTVGSLWKQVLSISSETQLWMPGNGLELSLWGTHAPMKEIPPTSDEIAKRLLFFLMVSDLRFRVAHCLGCGIYFLLPNRRYVHKRGTRCGECYSRFRDEDSVETTKAQRSQKRQAVCQAIAAKFGKRIAANEAWHRDKKIVQQIVAHVNTSIDKGKIDHSPISSKWVLRQSAPNNRAAIFAEAQRSVS